MPYRYADWLGMDVIAQEDPPGSGSWIYQPPGTNDWLEWPGEGGGGEGGGEGGGSWEDEILALAGPFAGEAADLGPDQPNPSWPELPPKMKPPIATGWPPVNSDIWQEPDGTWRVISADGAHVGVYEPDGRHRMTISRVTFTSGTYTITMRSDGTTTVSSPDGVAFDMTRYPVNLEQAEQYERTYVGEYYRGRNNGLTRSEANSAAQVAVSLAALAGMALTAQIAAGVLGIVQLIDSTAENINACTTAQPNLVSFCWLVKSYCQGLTGCLGTLSNFANTLATRATINFAGQPQYNGYIASVQAKKTEIDNYISVAWAWLSEATDDWQKWQSFDCSNGGGLLTNTVNNSLLPNKWNPRMTGGEGQVAEGSLMLRYAQFRESLDALHQNLLSPCQAEWDALPFPRNPGEY